MTDVEENETIGASQVDRNLGKEPNRVRQGAGRRGAWPRVASAGSFGEVAGHAVDSRHDSQGAPLGAARRGHSLIGWN